MPTALRNVRFQGQSGKHVLALSFSGFDPIASVRCDAELLRYRGIADSGKPTARQIYGFTA